MDFGVDPAAFDFTLEAQINVDSSVGDPAQLAFDWLDQGLSVLAGEVRAGVSGLPELAAEAREELRPGDDFAEIVIGRPSRGPARTASAAGLRWLRDALFGRPESVSLITGRLDETGLMAGGDLAAYVSTYPKYSGWMQLSATVRRSRFLDADRGLSNQRRWREFLEAFADRTNPGYGQINYFYYGGRTVVEEMANPRVIRRERRDVGFTISASREVLRGYGWLTIVPQELVDRLGGVQALTDSGAFSRVRALERGGVSLLVTDDFRDYSVQSVEAAFEVLAPVLPPGMPFSTDHRSPANAPVIIVSADPAEVAGAR